MAACLSAAIWLYIEASYKEASIFVDLWNSSIRFGFFLLLALFLKGIERERQYSRTDFMTGAFNHRYFHELLQREIDRSHRYGLSFTLAFIDMDNFKVVNDTFGHVFGDPILKAIVDTLRNSLRKTDIIARVGGDEFVILLPETKDQAAHSAIGHVVDALKEEMRVRKCPVTFSIGVVILTAPTQSPSQILGMADRSMYMVKHNGKDNVRFDIYQDV